jgi:hypothetical protein
LLANPTQGYSGASPAVALARSTHLALPQLAELSAVVLLHPAPGVSRAPCFLPVSSLLQISRSSPWLQPSSPTPWWFAVEAGKRSTGSARFPHARATRPALGSRFLEPSTARPFRYALRVPSPFAAKGVAHEANREWAPRQGPGLIIDLVTGPEGPPKVAALGGQAAGGSAKGWPSPKP